MLPFGKLRRGPDADQVDRLLHRSPAMGTAHRPAGDGRHLAGHEGRHRPGLINETLLELPRIQPGKHVAGSVAGGNAVGQVRKGADPFLLAPAEYLHLDPGIRAAKHGADGRGCDVRQLAPLASLHPRVRQVPKALHDRCTLSLHHPPSHITPPLNPAHSSTSLSLRCDCPANPGNRALTCGHKEHQKIDATGQRWRQSPQVAPFPSFALATSEAVSARRRGVQGFSHNPNGSTVMLRLVANQNAIALGCRTGSW